MAHQVHRSAATHPLGETYCQPRGQPLQVFLPIPVFGFAVARLIERRQFNSGQKLRQPGPGPGMSKRAVQAQNRPRVPFAPDPEGGRHHQHVFWHLQLSGKIQIEFVQPVLPPEKLVVHKIGRQPEDPARHRFLKVCDIGFG